MRNSLTRSSALWTLTAWLIAGLVCVPILVTLFSITTAPSPIWEHLKATVLTEYVVNSIVLMGLTGTCSLVLGVSTGWLIGACTFRGQRTLAWLLMLPLAAPAYIVAYVYTDLLEVSGPIQTTIRLWLSLQIDELQLPSIRSMPGAALLLSLVLYPYIYLLSRNSFAGRSGAQFDAARVLGHGPYSAFFRIALPAARPAIIGGLALVLMETLADFGVVSYFSVPTFSTGIYRTWIGLGDTEAALKLASLMLLFVIALVGIEEFNRRTSVDRSDLSRASPITLTGGRAAIAITVCAVPVIFGFVLPVCTLAIYAVTHWDPLLSRNFGSLALNSTSLAVTTGVLATLIAFALAYLKRLSPSPLSHSLIRISTLGYALPGILLAVAILEAAGALNQWQAEWWPAGTSVVLSGSVAILLYAYLCRFLTVAYQSVDAGFSAISHDVDAAARTLGAGPGQTLWRIHLPLLKPSMLAATLLVFVDVMRELPATLILRPFNFDTLATRVYRLASDERLTDASLAAIFIVLVGVIPVLLLHRSADVKRLD
jgi:iron(III) transport system permease protein